MALGRWRLLHRGPQALRLREAHLEVACGRHRRALLAQSFQKVRDRGVGWRGGGETLVCLGGGSSGLGFCLLSDPRRVRCCQPTPAPALPQLVSCLHCCLSFFHTFWLCGCGQVTSPLCASVLYV